MKTCRGRPENGPYPAPEGARRENFISHQSTTSAFLFYRSSDSARIPAPCSIDIEIEIDIDVFLSPHCPGDVCFACIEIWISFDILCKGMDINRLKDQ
jgi:hypothetical protein